MSLAFLDSLSRGRRPDDRRRGGRVRVELTDTSLGRVLDLSPTGVRVARRWPTALRQGDRVSLVIRSVQGRLTVLAEVVWVRKAGLLGRQVGLRFEGLDDAQRHLLTHIGRSAASNESVRHPSCRNAA